MQELYGDIGSAADRLTRIVEQLMDVSMIEKRKLSIERAPSDARRLCEEAIGKIGNRGFQDNIRLSISHGADSLFVDARRFTELLTILLENACTFSEESSEIEVDLERKGDEVELAVLDRGVGIPESDRESVFERFYQVDDAQHHSKPGMGFGLYIAARIVDASGGRIWCEPRDSGGTVFRVRIKA